MLHVSITSFVKASREQVWEKASTIAGVNEEFAPILKMTCPDPNAHISPSLVTGRPIFRSWLLLFGIFPVEYDLISIVECKEGFSFSEKSSMALLREWNHTRELTQTARGTKITDTLSFCPRAPLFFLGWIARAVVRILFRYRHYRLGLIFGSSISVAEVEEMKKYED